MSGDIAGAVGGAAPRNLTRAQFRKDVAERAGMSQADIQKVEDAMIALIERAIKAGQAVPLLGLVKLARKDKAARPAREGRNPGTGEKIMIPAKPASVTVKASALKGLKDMAPKR